MTVAKLSAIEKFSEELSWLGEVWWLFIGVGLIADARRWSIRLLILTVAVFGLIMVSAYGSILSALLITRQIVRPDRLAALHDGALFLVERNSLAENHLRDAQPSSLAARMGRRALPYDDVDAALAQAANDNDVLVLAYQRDYLHNDLYPCQVRSLN